MKNDDVCNLVDEELEGIADGVLPITPEHLTWVRPLARELLAQRQQMRLGIRLESAADECLRQFGTPSAREGLEKALAEWRGQ